MAKIARRKPSSINPAAELQSLIGVAGVQISSDSINCSVNQLRELSGALTNFTCRWNELQNDIDSIQKCIEELEGSQNADPSSVVSDAPATDPGSELDSIFETANGKALRRYVSARLSEADKLRVDITEALKQAPDLDKLIMDCMGKFYIQGSKAFEKQPALVSVRKACILVLECFLSAGGYERINPSMKAEASAAANAWKDRIVKESGVDKCQPVDAQGLLLFIASFGVPPGFNEDFIFKLVKSSKFPKDDNVIRSSPFLQQKIGEMVSNAKYVKAVDLSCGIGLQEKYPPKDLLSSFLNEINENAKKMRREGQGSKKLLQAADAYQLSSLKSISECLKRNHLDGANFVELNLNEKILKLEKDNLLSSKSSERKRRSTVQPCASEELRAQEAKRLHFGNADVPSQMPHFGARFSYHDSGIGSQYGYHGFAEGLPDPLFSLAGGHPAATRAAGNFEAVGGTLSGIPDGKIFADSGIVSQADRGMGRNYDLHFGDVSLTDKAARENLLDGYYTSAVIKQAPGDSFSLGHQGSSLYQFADMVMESEPYLHSSSVAAPSVLRSQFMPFM